MNRLSSYNTYHYTCGRVEEGIIEDKCCSNHHTLDDARIGPLTSFAEASTGLCWFRLTSGAKSMNVMVEQLTVCYSSAYIHHFM